ncbi:TPA: helix-turn-helix domain-containing protein [Legionella pneumophila]|nr:helix-turn-helix domain-containing protein [Legionella pneumophila]HAT1872390.1 helix-turn-helix domain-containing protein [Legionella pneumophila]HAT7921612.1 helix-turn-helix domain-containing protein [Legionella pneumophila]HAT8309070.1 helix-turn-helix domain-containing protein [Legionella pneumophila]HAT8739367.1 helix-turn-helix domain-containing protein [Legionella pneumophila]
MTPIPSFYNEKKRMIKQICELVGISKPTLYKYLSRL